MNKSNQLLAMLDRVFGWPNKIKSTFRKVSQDFDERTGEHVILIEYRIRAKGTFKSAPSKRQKQKQLALHRQVLDLRKKK